MLAQSPAALIDALHSEGPAPDRADRMSLYGQFVGSWEMEVVFPEEYRHQRGEIHFGWVLEGRAIQDVWITPPRGDPTTPRQPAPQESAAIGFYGTTLRIYDPERDAWHILWIDPVKQYYARQIGRAEGHDIVQVGTDDTGAATRWSFPDITPDTFRWRGERSDDGGKTWHQLVEFFARRIAGSA